MPVSRRRLIRKEPEPVNEVFSKKSWGTYAFVYGAIILLVVGMASLFLTQQQNLPAPVIASPSP